MTNRAETPHFRIAMAVASPFPANHGTPGSIREMAEAIAARGHEIHVVAYHFGDGPAPPGVQVHHIPDLGMGRKVTVGPTWQKPLQDLQMVLTLRRVVKETNADLIHAHNYEGALVGYLAHLLTGRPLLYNACNTMGDELTSYGFLPNFIASPLAKTLDYVVPRLPDTTVAVSEDLARFLAGQGVPKERLHAIPLGIDPGIFDRVDHEAARKKVRGDDPRPIVIYTGCLDGLQRIDYLLQAMTEVVPKRPDVRLLLLANAVKERDLARYQEMARELGIASQLEVVPSDSFEDVPVYLSAADVAVVPRPACPGFPVKLLNYLAARKPTVVSAGSSKGLTDGENSRLAPDHDWRALGKGILELLEDREKAERLGRNGRVFVEERYAWPVLTDRMIDVYRDLVGPRGGSIEPVVPGGGASSFANRLNLGEVLDLPHSHLEVAGPEVQAEGEHPLEVRLPEAQLLVLGHALGPEPQELALEADRPDLRGLLEHAPVLTVHLAVREEDVVLEEEAVLVFLEPVAGDALGHLVLEDRRGEVDRKRRLRERRGPEVDRLLPGVEEPLVRVSELLPGEAIRVGPRKVHLRRVGVRPGDVDHRHPGRGRKVAPHGPDGFVPGREEDGVPGDRDQEGLPERLLVVPLGVELLAVEGVLVDEGEARGALLVDPGGGRDPRKEAQVHGTPRLLGDRDPGVQGRPVERPLDGLDRVPELVQGDARDAGHLEQPPPVLDRAGAPDHVDPERRLIGILRCRGELAPGEGQQGEEDASPDLPHPQRSQR
jgi:glycosyltransferase involved in cell wall biosynthesis